MTVLKILDLLNIFDSILYLILNLPFITFCSIVCFFFLFTTVDHLHNFYLSFFLIHFWQRSCVIFCANICTLLIFPFPIYWIISMPWTCLLTKKWVIFKSLYAVNQVHERHTCDLPFNGRSFMIVQLTISLHTIILCESISQNSKTTCWWKFY